jgi:hypothetical protein
MRDLVRSKVKSLKCKPKAGSHEAECLVSFQNRGWFYDLLLSSWTVAMISLMSKYLEHHDKDGITLLFCFIKHFAGASKESIIDAYRQLTENQVQLSLYNNDVTAFTNAIHILTHQLANCQEQPTFQHILNVYHGIMDCPNKEFRAYVHNIYREYRQNGPASKWTMLQLLDHLDEEYKRIKSLNRWDKGTNQGNPEIIALTAEISHLKILLANINKNNGTTLTRSTKPTKPPKDSEPETTTINGTVWHYCKTCFGGKGAWNKTHTTDKHVVGAGKGYKGGPKKTPDPPTPTPTPTPTDAATANLASQAIADDTPSADALFFV